MTKLKNWIVLLVVVLLMSTGVLAQATADDDDHKDRGSYQRRSESHHDGAYDHDEGNKKRHRKRQGKDSHEHEKAYLTPVSNQTFKDACGACHFAYQPELLPSGSWDKILAGLDDHFGESIDLDPDSKKEIAVYLKTNAAEYSSAKRAKKIMRSLGSQTPLRITQVPYLIKKHDDIDPAVIRRESIGSLANCSACHTTAEQGIYDDDHVVIPRQ